MNINNNNNIWNMENQKSYLNHTARGLVGFFTLREIPPAHCERDAVREFLMDV